MAITLFRDIFFSYDLDFIQKLIKKKKSRVNSKAVKSKHLVLAKKSQEHSHARWIEIHEYKPFQQQQYNVNVLKE